MTTSVPNDMMDFLEGIIHQEKFVKEGIEYDVKAFTSPSRVEVFVQKNEGFSVMREENNYIYVVKKTDLSEELINSADGDHTGMRIMEAADKVGITRESALALIELLSQPKV